MFISKQSAADAEAADGQSTVVLVHGAWHNAQHWRRVVGSLDAIGRRSLCIDLPGHGASGAGAYLDDTSEVFKDGVSAAARVTVEEAATGVLDALRGVRGAKPILVGHSLGGIIITRAAEIAPDLIGHLVYLTAHLPIRLKSAAAYAQLPEWRTGYGDGLFAGDPTVTGVVRINPRGNIDYLEQMRQAYYNDVSFEEFLPFARALTPDLPLDFWVADNVITAERWGRIPRTYIRCTLDRALAPAIQSMMIQEANALTPENPFRVIDLESSHSPFASQPNVVAALLADITVV